MKKVLALVLAVVLAFGMTTVAFATPKNDKVTTLTLGSVYEGDPKDGNIAGGATSFANNLKANTSYYIEIIATTSSPNTVLDSGHAKKLSQVSEYKIRTAIEEGSAYISSKPAFVVKKNSANVNNVYITFKTADKFNKDDVSIDMGISIFGGTDYAPTDFDAGKDLAKITSTVGYGDPEAMSTYSMKDGSDQPWSNFDGIDGDMEIEFKESVVFAVNGKDQKDLFLRMSTKDDALTDKYPDADLAIIKFEGNNKTFRRTGTLTIPADMVENKDGKMVAPVLYNYEGGKLTVNKDAKYNEEKSAFEIKTNKLGNYVVAGTALPASAPSTDGTTDEEPTAPGTVPNPDTGANDFVGLAVALAVVSVAGIAVAKRK